MWMRARTVTTDERGMSIVFVGLGLMAFVAATMLAIDVGMLMTSRAQAQTSADAGAHAGAVALAFDDYFNRSDTGPAKQNAVQRALANKVMAGNVSVTPADVEFVNDPTGEPNRVRVHVYRDAAHGNPMDTFIARLFGTNTMDISAVATAEASFADIPDRCFPFAIPDRWEELTNPPYNADTSEFNLYAGPSGKQFLDPHDVYIPLGQDGYTGYDPIADRGTLVVLKAGNGSKVSPSVYNPITIPGVGTGAENYGKNILNGPCADFKIGSHMTIEPGMMQGPTMAAIKHLVDEVDPDAHWDTACRCVKGGMIESKGWSPRVGAIPLYNPAFYEENKQEGRNADFVTANYLGVFIEGLRGNDVLARIVPIGGHRSGEPVPNGAFLKTIRIVQ